MKCEFIASLPQERVARRDPLVDSRPLVRTLSYPRKSLQHFYLLEFVHGYGENIAVHANEIGEFPRFERTLAVFLKSCVGSVARIESERRFYGDALLGRENLAALQLFPRHRGPDAPPRAERRDRDIGAGSLDDSATANSTNACELLGCERIPCEAFWTTYLAAVFSSGAYYCAKGGLTCTKQHCWL